MAVPTFTTARTVVRPWRIEEADRLLDIRSSDPVVRWLSEPTPWRDIGQARDAIAAWSLPNAKAPYLCVWAIVATATGIPAGSVSLDPLHDDVEVEIGSYLQPDAQGRGLAADTTRGAGPRASSRTTMPTRARNAGRTSLIVLNDRVMVPRPPFPTWT